MTASELLRAHLAQVASVPDAAFATVRNDAERALAEGKPLRAFRALADHYGLNAKEFSEKLHRDVSASAT